VNPEHTRPIFVPRGAGTVLESLAVVHKLTTDQTAGTCYLFESTFEPGSGNRMHLHRHEDEIGYVLDGVLEVRTGGEARLLEAGGLARLPRGIPHGLRNPSTTSSSRYLFIAVPAGLDRWFDAVARAARDGSLDDTVFRELSLEHGLEWLE
jgi:quercetin dioxygenase-like cupin family protein